jgi:hypothetical protein
MWLRKTALKIVESFSVSGCMSNGREYRARCCSSYLMASCPPHEFVPNHTLEDQQSPALRRGWRFCTSGIEPCAAGGTFSEANLMLVTRLSHGRQKEHVYDLCNEHVMLVSLPLSDHRRGGVDREANPRARVMVVQNSINSTSGHN